MPRDVASITREHVEAFIAGLLERWKPATANNRYRGLQSFFRWLVAEGEIGESPMVHMKPPRVPDNPPDVLREEELRALLATCERGARFDDRRDAAILRAFIDTGARRAEIAGLRWNPGDDDNNDVDLDRGLLRVIGKGRRERVLPIGAKTVKALDRYIRKRSQHPAAAQPWLWLGRKGRMTETGIFQTVRKRGQQAGVGQGRHHCGGSDSDGDHDKYDWERTLLGNHIVPLGLELRPASRPMGAASTARLRRPWTNPRSRGRRSYAPAPSVSFWQRDTALRSGVSAR